MKISFIHVKTESGDDYYFDVYGEATKEELPLLMWNLMGDESDYIDYSHIHVAETP